MTPREAGAELVLFPELALTGYPPEDLLLQGALPRRRREPRSRSCAGDTHGDGRDRRLSGARRGHVYNAAAVLADGAVQAIYRKVHLPNYGVFDEQRYFQAGAAGAVIDVGCGSASG